MQLALTSKKGYPPSLPSGPLHRHTHKRELTLPQVPNNKNDDQAERAVHSRSSPAVLVSVVYHRLLWGRHGAEATRKVDWWYAGPDWAVTCE